ncbi:MAG: VWA domain-containing protein [Synergistaceae bacterium]|nr:VWA domain-containing protein [Synergistaceae bacterium]MBQ6665214.1 VWA domain-containing protein [Synergistaceae bacterium]
MKFKRKCFYWFAVMLLFSLIASGGCGGSSSNIAPIQQEDNTSDDVTPREPVIPISPDNPVPEERVTSPDVAVFTVSFIDFDGSEIAVQKVQDEGTATEPQAPEREGYIFLGWLDADGFLYNFDNPVYEDIALAAYYAELEEVTEYELAILKQSADIEGEVAVSFDAGSPITGVSISYDLDSIGTVMIAPISQNPMLGTAGLLGSPISINSVGGDVKRATITFSYDPELVRKRAIELCDEYKKLSVDVDINTVNLDDLAVVWYDESNDIAVLLEDSLTNARTHTLTASTTHFSNFGAVVRDLWDSMWGAKLPAVRTESTPYYDVVMALDYSGSMSDADIRQSVTAAQGLVDVLADDDYVTVIAFGSRAASIVEHKKVGIEREAIKQAITLRNPGVGSGTEFDAALGLAKTYKPSDSHYQPLIILLSDGGSSISNSLLDELNGNGQKVITVGIGSGVATDKMQMIAERTGGSYIFAETASDLKDAFLDLQSTYIGSTKDTDGDGLPDLVETSGMRDQYGKIWRTNPNLSNTDGDGYSDGEEMGEYKSLFVDHPYFRRVSNPNKTTFKVSIPLVPELPGMTYFDTQTGNNSNVIKLWCLTEDQAYLETADHETVYSKFGNLKVELVDIPEGFRLDEIKTTETDKGSGNILYKTTAKLSYYKDADLTGAKWKITADGRLGSPWTVAVSPKQVKYTVNNDLLFDAEKCMEEVETYFINQLCGDAQNAQPDNTQSLEDLKKQIKAQPYLGRTSEYEASELPEDVYEAFARVIFETLESANINRFNFDLDKVDGGLVEQVYAWLSAGIRSGTDTTSINGRNYTVKYYINALSVNGNGAGFSTATVSWKWDNGKKGKLREEHEEIWDMNWASNPKAGLNALSHYCAVLVQLELDVWKEFLSTFVIDAFGIKYIKKKEVTKATIREALDAAENVIKALHGDRDAAEELVKGTEGKLKEALEKGIETLVEKFIPNGKQYVDTAKKIWKVAEKRKALETALLEYNAAKDKGRADAEIVSAYKQFKTAYNDLKGIEWYEKKTVKFPELPEYTNNKP